MIIRTRRWLNVSVFTFSELMVVLVIIRILVLMALPKLMPLISRTKSAKAPDELML